MTIYELKKQATPGPLVAIEDMVYCLTPDDPTRGHCPLAQILPVWAQGTPNASAAMLAHCRNHFMEALAALKEEHYSFMANHPRERCKMCKLIAKLEEVE